MNAAKRKRQRLAEMRRDLHRRGEEISALRVELSALTGIVDQGELEEFIEKVWGPDGDFDGERAEALMAAVQQKNRALLDDITAAQNAIIQETGAVPSGLHESPRPGATRPELEAQLDSILERRSKLDELKDRMDPIESVGKMMADAQQYIQPTQRGSRPPVPYETWLRPWMGFARSALDRPNAPLAAVEFVRKDTQDTLAFEARMHAVLLEDLRRYIQDGGRSDPKFRFDRTAWQAREIPRVVLPLAAVAFGDTEALLIEHEVEAHGVWGARGRQTYELSHGIATRFAATETHGIGPEDFRLPFPAFRILLPAACQQEVDPRVAPGARLVGLTVFSSGDSVTVSFMADRLGVGNTDYVFWGFSFTPSRRVFDDFEGAITARFVRDEQGHQPGPRETELSRFAFRMVVNTVLYCTSREARLETVMGNREAEALLNRIHKLPPGKKKEGLKDRLRPMDLQRRIIVGPGVEPIQLTDGHARGPLRVRTLVTGHWRNQAHGPHHSLRRPKWIEPFWRGDELAPVVQHEREVR